MAWYSMTRMPNHPRLCQIRLSLISLFFSSSSISIQRAFSRCDLSHVIVCVPRKREKQWGTLHDPLKSSEHSVLHNKSGCVFIFQIVLCTSRERENIKINYFGSSALVMICSFVYWIRLQGEWVDNEIRLIFISLQEITQRARVKTCKQICLFSQTPSQFVNNYRDAPTLKSRLFVSLSITTTMLQTKLRRMCKFSSTSDQLFHNKSTRQQTPSRNYDCKSNSPPECSS